MRQTAKAKMKTMKSVDRFEINKLREYRKQSLNFD